MEKSFWRASFWLLLGAVVVFGFTGPESSTDTGRAMQMIENLRQKTVELERTIDGLRGNLEALRREIRSELRERDAQVSLSIERLKGERRDLERRLDRLESSESRRIEDGELIRIEAVVNEAGEAINRIRKVDRD